jgi:DNA-binding LacI/PurR family transcriptional regulator
MGAAFESIKHDIRRKIMARTWLSGTKIPSSRELAAQYNCSINTVEKCLKDLQAEGLLVRELRRGTFIAETTSMPAMGMPTVISDAIAVVVDDVNSYIFSKALRGIENVLMTRGFGLTISSHDNDPVRQEHILRGLVEKGVRGIILYPALAFENDDRSYKNLERMLAKSHVVCMDRYIYNSRLSMPYVTSDNFHASYQVTRLLIENGHRQIGLVRNYNVSTTVERLMGYRQALHDFGIPFRSEMDIVLHVRNENMESFSSDWLAPFLESLHPTAFFTTTYNLAGHLMNGLARLGLSIPKDISLVSYEVEYMNSFLPLKITGVTQRFYEMGKMAAKLVLEMLDSTREPEVSGYVCHSTINAGKSVLALA